MYNSKCRCPHHIVAIVIGVLTWVSAILFLWTAWRSTLIFGFNAGAYFSHVVVFALLGFGLMSGMCKCCYKGGKMGCACNCGDCVGGKCDSRHSADHTHM